MDRIFHPRIGWWYWLLIAVTSVFLFYFFWEHHTLVMLILAVCVIFEIEMLIHTRYVISSDNYLRIETGRFVRNSTIDINSILRVRKVRSLAFWAPALSFDRLEIVCVKKSGKGTASVLIAPQNQEEFINWLLKRNSRIQVDI
ncbi:PH domain-containing protein [uncultured Phocaeicola sp.]|jgi:hypothetical protein|uniref:PH domain-containing protein n=1 Tax=uncultured Phocaeicola sp. TaxID=990718 RepID=UPI0025DA0089|nr:PH domain-containing protein [uncultured Phocaeicola sp.]